MLTRNLLCWVEREVVSAKSDAEQHLRQPDDCMHLRKHNNASQAGADVSDE